MSKKPLFSDDVPASDIAYRNIRMATNDYSRAARDGAERLWDLFEPYADPEFAIEFSKEFDARYWEMYLTCYFIEAGLEVTCPKPGPDVGVVVEGRRVWFEATSPTRGADGHPDQVPELRAAAPGEVPVVHDTPNEKLMLRYLSAISEKYDRQYPRWLKAGVVSPDDALVVAVNPRRLGHEFGDTVPPRILQAAFTIGQPYVVIDSRTTEQVGAGYQFRGSISKASGAAVGTGVFQSADHVGLSGVLCSRIDAANQPELMGADFQFVPNPNARVPLPERFRLRGTYFRVEASEDGYRVTPEQG
jgi:hypothetical protein